MNALAAKQKILIDLIWIPFLFLTAHRAGIHTQGQVDRPLRTIVNVGSWPELRRWRSAESDPCQSLGRRPIGAKWMPKSFPTSEVHHDTLSRRACRRLQEVPDRRCLSLEDRYW